MLSRRQKMLSGLMALVFSVFTAIVPAMTFAAETGPATSRIGGVDRYETTAKVAQAGWVQSDYAVLSAGANANLVDALTAAPLAKLKKAPILLTQGNALNSYAEAELTRLGVKTVYVTSGSGVIQQPVLDKLESMGITVEVLGGKDRFETSVNIAKKFTDVKRIVVATAWTNADALSVSSIAAAKGYPILLTNVNTVPTSVDDYIDGISDKLTKTYIIGGNQVVSDTVLGSLPEAVRVGGANRYATNVEVLKTFYGTLKPGKVFIANGQNAHLVDSLAGAPYAAMTSSPVVLTNTTMPQTTQEYVKKYLLPNKLVALGGENVVASGVLNSLKAFTAYSENGSTQGSSDATNLLTVNEAIRVTGDNITLKNISTNYSIYITGDNASLDNVTVKGSVFIDPGSNGSAFLEKVTADKIVVLSGGKDSIHISQSNTGELVVTSRDDQDAPSTVRVVAENSSQIGSTTVSTYSIIDAETGSVMGTVTITSEPGVESQVELRGEFTEEVVIEEDVDVSLAAGTQVTKITRNTEGGSLNVPAGASVGELSGSTSGVSGSGTVGDETADSVGDTPAAPPSTGGGGGGGTTPTAPLITALPNYASVDNSTKQITFASPYTNLSLSSITVDKASTAKIYRTVGATKTELGSWALNSGLNSNLFTVNNLKRLNMSNTFEAVRAASVNVFDITNFTEILNAVKTSPSKQDFYDDIMPAVADMAESNSQAVYTSLDMGAIYTAAGNDALYNTQDKIKASLANAVIAFNNLSATDVTLENVSGQGGSSLFTAAMVTINGSSVAAKEAFYENIVFTDLLNACKDSNNKTEIYNAFNFQNIFNALNDSAQQDSTFYGSAAIVYLALDGLDTATKNNMSDAVNITLMLSELAQNGETITLELTDTTNNLTTAYSIVF